MIWMTDNDAIASNDKQTMNAIRLLQAVLPLYTDNQYDTTGVALPFQERNVQTLDLLSATDLVAGAVERYLSLRDEMGELTMKQGAEKILQWLGHDGVGLKKFVIQIYREPDGFRGRELAFTPKNIPRDTQFVPI